MIKKIIIAITMTMISRRDTPSSDDYDDNNDDDEKYDDIIIANIIVMCRNSWTRCTSLQGKLLKTRSSSSSRSTILTVCYKINRFYNLTAGQTQTSRKLKLEAAGKNRKQMMMMMVMLMLMMMMILCRRWADPGGGAATRDEVSTLFSFLTQFLNFLARQF